MSKYTGGSLCLLVVALIAILNGCCSPDLPGPGGVPLPAAPILSVLTSSCTAAAVGINQRLFAQFSAPVDPATINATTFIVTGPGATAVAGAVTLDPTGTIATFTPAAPLAPSTAFTLTVTTGVRTVAGVALPNNFVCGFTTTAGADVILPQVLSNFPVCGSVGAALDRPISVTFTEPMDPLTITAAGNITLTGPGGAAVAGTVTFNAVNNTATFTPAANLAPNTAFSLNVAVGASGVTDLAGNPLAGPGGVALAVPFNCAFITGGSPSGLTPVDTPCDTFTVLAGSTVTNTGPTRVIGNLGLSPGTSVTGFPPGLVVPPGVMHVANAPAAMAQAELTAAFNDAASRPTNATIAGDLAGQTLTPGVYRSATSIQVSGNLTLDALGDPNAVFIFQLGTTLTTGAASQILLINGAQARNVFWQVGSSATLGLNSLFSGVILADQSITVTTGTTVNGCVLARIGAVTLDSNNVNGQ
jgi:hypothetical protein